MWDKWVLRQAPDDDGACDGRDKPGGGTGGKDGSEASGELQGSSRQGQGEGQGGSCGRHGSPAKVQEVRDPCPVVPST